MSGLEASHWAGSQFGPITGPPFPQALLQVWLCSYFKEEQFWVRLFDCGMATYSSFWCPVFILEVDSTSSLLILWGISSVILPFESWWTHSDWFFFSLPTGIEASSLGPFSVLNFLSFTDYILKSKRIMDLNIKPDTVNLIEKKVGKSLKLLLWKVIF